MAPEIIKNQVYNEKVDIWSIGVITYMLLSGRNPFPGRTKEEVKFMIVNDEADLNKPAFNKVSDLAKQFIRCALTKNTHKRYSAKELLDHPWLQGISKEAEQEVNMEEQTEVLQNLQNFAKFSKFQKTIFSVLLGLRADKVDLKRLKQ